MAHPFEIAKDLEVEASPQRVWEAIATGPGQDSWFMGRSEIEPREGGAARWSIGDFTMESTVTAWEPPTHFVFRMNEAPDGTYHQFDYRIEPRDGGRAGIRYVHSGMLSGDWEAEYEAMSEGDPAYLHKLVEYLTYFPGRFATGVDAQGPQVADRERVMAAYRRGLGLGDTVVEGDKVQLTPQGLAPIDGSVDYLSPHFLGVRSDDAIHRFIHGFQGTTMVGHHLFRDGVNEEEAERSWRAWLGSLFDGTDATIVG